MMITGSDSPSAWTPSTFTLYGNFPFCLASLVTKSWPGSTVAHNCVVHGDQDAVNPAKQGTKVAAHYRLAVGPGESATVRLRLTARGPREKSAPAAPFGPGFDAALAVRLQEADEFYRAVTPTSVSPDAANVMRQAIAGMLWSKQFYFFDGDSWLKEHHSNPLHAGYRNARNSARPGRSIRDRTGRLLAPVSRIEGTAGGLSTRSGNAARRDGS